MSFAFMMILLRTEKKNQKVPRKNATTLFNLQLKEKRITFIKITIFMFF